MLPMQQQTRRVGSFCWRYNKVLISVSKHCYHKTETEQMSLPDAFSSEQKNYKPLLNEFNHGALVSFNW